MKHIMGVTTKGDDLVGGCDQGRLSWGKVARGEGSVSITHVDDIGKSHIGCASPTSDPLVDVDPETVNISDNICS